MYELARKTFWHFVLTLFPHWCIVSRLYLVSIPSYWTWTKTTSQKKEFFWSNPYKIEVVISSLIVAKLCSHDHIYHFSQVIKFCWWRHGQQLWLYNLYFKNLYFKKARVAIFADIIKILTMFVKIILKDSKKVIRIRNYVSKCNLYLYFFNIANFADFQRRNTDVSKTQSVCHVIHTFFGSSLCKV